MVAQWEFGKGISKTILSESATPTVVPHYSVLGNYLTHLLEWGSGYRWVS